MNWKGLKVKSMRIVSQNGMIDVPYEMIALYCTETMVRMCMVGDTGRGTVMAEYSTPEKVQKAMELLHHEYIGIMPSLVIDNRNSFDAESMEILKNSTVGALVRPVNPGDVEVHMLPRIFRFPADDEIEVKP